MIDEREPVVRQRFSAAHELAHIVLFKNQASTVCCSKNSRGWQEKLCDRFAGDILMPEERVRDIYMSTPIHILRTWQKYSKLADSLLRSSLKD